MKYKTKLATAAAVEYLNNLMFHNNRVIPYGKAMYASQQLKAKGHDITLTAIVGRA